jgi:hypothetical protein
VPVCTRWSALPAMVGEMCTVCPPRLNALVE